MEGGLRQATGRLWVGEYKLVFVWGAPPQERKLEGRSGLRWCMRWSGDRRLWDIQLGSRYGLGIAYSWFTWENAWSKLRLAGIQRHVGPPPLGRMTAYPPSPLLPAG